jgi:subtilisin family serine protease
MTSHPAASARQPSAQTFSSAAAKVAAGIVLALVSATTPVSTPAVTEASGTPATYVLVGADDRLPSGLPQQLSSIGGTLTYALPEIGVAIAHSTRPGFAAEAAALQGLRSVLPDVLIPLAPATVSATGNPPSSGDDDSFFDLQWALDAIDAPEAWAGGYRGAGARVAVLDTGVDVDHPDLVANLNQALSTSFIPGLDVAAPPGPGVPLLGPLHHGTWVAGIIAAADNGVGTIGVAPEAELVAVRVCHEPDGPCPFSAILSGIVYAASIGSDVINLSIQALLPRSAIRDEQGSIIPASQVQELLVAFRRAFRFAESRGSTSVVIAGNDGRSLDGDASLVQLWPDLAHVMAISATGPNGWAVDPTTNLDLPAFYTNYGRSAIDFAAPGGNLDFDLIAPEPLPMCTVAGLWLPCAYFDTVVGPTAGGWTFAFGTSGAAPHVAGVAALVVGSSGGKLSPATVKAILRDSADDLGSAGLDPLYGHGRVNAARAVAR